MMPVIRIGSASIQASILAFLVALWVGASIAERQARRRDLHGDDVWTALTIFLGVTVVAGRLIYVLQYLDAYTHDWTEVFSFSPNTLALEYGALCGLGAVYAFVWWKRIPLARFADALVLGLLAALAILAFGQFLSGDAYGTLADVPWAISLFGESRHPVQLYESLAVGIGVVVILQIAKSNTRDGGIALLAIAWYSALRLFIDAFRADVPVLGNGYRATQVVALGALLFSLWMMKKTEDERRRTEDR